MNFYVDAYFNRQGEKKMLQSHVLMAFLHFRAQTDSVLWQPEIVDKEM